MIKLNKYEQEEYDSYTKEQIYQAYVTEVGVRMKLNKELNELMRRIAKLKFDIKRLSND